LIKAVIEKSKKAEKAEKAADVIQQSPPKDVKDVVKVGLDQDPEETLDEIKVDEKKLEKEIESDK